MPSRSAVAGSIVSILFSLALAVESHFAGEDLHQHFQNPGPVNWFSTAQLLLTATVALILAGERTAERPFWLLFGVGFAFFALDQQWKPLTDSSEQDLHGAVGNYIRDNFWLSEPLVLQWSDALVACYLLGGCLGIIRYRDLLFRSDRLASDLLGALFFVALMVLTDSFLVQLPLVKVFEETLKLVAGSFFLSGVLSTWWVRRQLDQENTAKAGPGSEVEEVDLTVRAYIRSTSAGERLCSPSSACNSQSPRN
jgi:hypothetical protein